MEYRGKKKEIPSQHNRFAYIFMYITHTQSKYWFDLLYSVSLSLSEFLLIAQNTLNQNTTHILRNTTTKDQKNEQNERGIFWGITEFNSSIFPNDQIDENRKME